MRCMHDTAVNHCILHWIPYCNCKQFLPGDTQSAITLEVNLILRWDQNYWCFARNEEFTSFRSIFPLSQFSTILPDNDRLRSKHFCVVSEQRKTEKRQGTGFSVLAARKMEREPYFSRGLWLSFLVNSLLPNRTETLTTQAKTTTKATICPSSVQRHLTLTSVHSASKISC